MVQQYLDHAHEILTSPRTNFKRGSKGSGLVSLFGSQNEYDLREGFPLLTTKKMYHEGIIHELIWFMKGETNIKYLEDNGIKIWRRDAFQHNLPGMIKEGIFQEGMKKYSTSWESALQEYGQRIIEDKEFAQRFADAGPIYGKQWRAWETFDPNLGKIVKVDQLQNMINGLKKKPTGKKHIVSAWQPGDVPRMSLPPCHVMFQATSDGDGNLEVQLYQRSCDEFLGVPYNIASYALLTKIIAQEVGMKPKTFIHSFGDAHFYSGLAKRGEWYQEHFEELQSRVRDVSERSGYLEVLDWISTNVPKDKSEKKYDHVTAILRQLSREPKQMPHIEISNKPFEELTIDDFVIGGYTPAKPIRREMAV